MVSLATWKPKYEALPMCDLLCDESESDFGEDTGSEDEFAKLKVDWLPAWLYTSSLGVPHDVKTLMKTKMENPDKRLGRYGGNLTMFDVSGPAVALLWLATAIFWLSILAFPFVAFQFTECNGLALPRYQCWLWCLVLPVLVVIMAIEWRCFTYTITPVVQALGKVESPPFHQFYLQFAWQTCLGAVSKAELVTQSLLLSSICRWFTCSGWTDVAASWVEVWNNSIFSWVTPGRHLPSVLFVTWGMVLVQLLLFVMAAFPLEAFRGHLPSFHLRSEKDGYYVVSWSLGPECQWSRIWHADALKTLVSLNRMPWVGAIFTPLQLKRAQIAAESGEAERSLQILKMELRQMVPRMFLINLCQNCMKLEVQVAIFSLGQIISSTTSWQCFFCIVLAQINSIFDLYEMLTRALKTHRFISDSHGPLRRDSSRNSEDGSRMRPEEFASETFGQVYWLLRVVVLQGALCLFVQLHSVAKLSGAFQCPDAIWNLDNTCAEVETQ